MRHVFTTKELILDRLLAKDMTTEMLAESIGHRIEHIRRRVKALHEEGKIHIAGWTKPHNICIPIYTAGKGQDAPRPEPLKKRRPKLNVDKPKTSLEKYLALHPFLYKR